MYHLTVLSLSEAGSSPASVYYFVLFDQQREFRAFSEKKCIDKNSFSHPVYISYPTAVCHGWAILPAPSCALVTCPLKVCWQVGQGEVSTHGLKDSFLLSTAGMFVTASVIETVIEWRAARPTALLSPLGHTRLERPEQEEGRKKENYS